MASSTIAVKPGSVATWRWYCFASRWEFTPVPSTPPGDRLVARKSRHVKVTSSWTVAPFAGESTSIGLDSLLNECVAGPGLDAPTVLSLQGSTFQKNAEPA